MDWRHYPELPYEDLHQTKDIIRLLLQQLHLTLSDGRDIASVHHVIKDIRQQTHKLGDLSLVKAVDNMAYLIDHNWPLSATSSLDMLHQLKGYFLYIDEKTVF